MEERRDCARNFVRGGKEKTKTRPARVFPAFVPKHSSKIVEFYPRMKNECVITYRSQRCKLKFRNSCLSTFKCIYVVHI